MRSNSQMTAEQLQQEIEDAQAEMKTWSAEKIASVQLEGVDYQLLRIRKELAESPKTAIMFNPSV